MNPRNRNNSTLARIMLIMCEHAILNPHRYETSAPEPDNKPAPAPTTEPTWTPEMRREVVAEMRRLQQSHPHLNCKARKKIARKLVLEIFG